MSEEIVLNPINFPLLSNLDSAVRIIEELLSEADAAQASDIHLDPAAHAVIVRFRINGTLHDILELPLKLKHEILARFKILAGLRIDEHQIPQDGRFRFDVGETHSIDVRVSIAPT
jgi:type IV pilus assembly protein PilB